MMKKTGNGAALALMVLSTLLSSAALAMYLTNGTNKLCPDMKTACTVGLACAAALGLVLTIWGLSRKKMPVLLCYVQYLCALVGFGEYIVSQLNYIANVIYGVDGNSFTAVMIATAGTSLLSWVLSLIAANMQRRSVYRSESAAQEG